MMTFREIDTDQFYDALWWPQSPCHSAAETSHILCDAECSRLDSNNSVKCRISITQQRPNCALNCSETREIKAKTSKWWWKQSEKAVWFQGVVWGLDQHHYHHHHQPQQHSFCWLSVRVISPCDATSAMNKLIELIMMVELTCFLQISADCCSIL